MACILHIDTSTDVCSVALSDNGSCVFEREDHAGSNHTSLLGGFVSSALAFADKSGLRLDAVSVSAGPGSYTGLRIGTSMAKGLCYGRDLKLIAIPTLEILCVPILIEREDLPDDALLCPMIDARRMEVYTAVYDRGLRVKKDVTAEIIDEESFADLLENHQIYFFGNGSEKCKKVITHSNAHFISCISPLARNMMPLAEKAMLYGRFEDVAYFVPFYLKDFVAKTPNRTE